MQSATWVEQSARRTPKEDHRRLLRLSARFHDAEDSPWREACLAWLLLFSDREGCRGRGWKGMECGGGCYGIFESFVERWPRRARASGPLESSKVRLELPRKRHIIGWTESNASTPPRVSGCGGRYVDVVTAQERVVTIAVQSITNITMSDLCPPWAPFFGYVTLVLWMC